jgi:hypothetical protein
VNGVVEARRVLVVVVESSGLHGDVRPVRDVQVDVAGQVPLISLEPALLVGLFAASELER